MLSALSASPGRATPSAPIPSVLRTAKDNHELMSTLDMSFHMRVAEAAHNQVLPLILRPIQMLMPAIKTDVYDLVEDAHETAVHWHARILDAILERDAEGARDAMAGHLEIAMEHVQRASQSKPSASSQSAPRIPRRAPLAA